MNLFHWFLHTSSQLCEIFKQETFSLKLVTSFTYSSVLSYLTLLENGNKTIFTTAVYLQLAKESYIEKMVKWMQALSSCVPVATAHYGLIGMRVTVKIPA